MVLLPPTSITARLVAAGIEDTLSTKVLELTTRGVYETPLTVIRVVLSKDELESPITVIVVVTPTAAEAMLGETEAIEGPSDARSTGSVIDITDVPPNERAPLAALALSPLS